MKQELLALIFGGEYFSIYLQGRKFNLWGTSLCLQQEFG